MTLLTKKITKAGIVGALLFGLGSFSDARAQDAIKNYWNSNNGMTGGYIEGKVFYGSMSDISNSYDTSTWIPASAVTTSAAGADQDWSFDELVGAKFKYCNLNNVRFENCFLQGTHFKKCTHEHDMQSFTPIR